MRVEARRVVAVATFAIALGLQAGCAFQRGVSRDAVAFNQAVEEAQNRTILMNIVRASEREPMVFTELAKVTGTISGQIGLDFGIPFDGKEAIANPSMLLKGGPTYDVLSLSSKEFMSGIMTPASPLLLKYYWDQGFPKEFLLYMFVHEVRDPNGRTLVVNQPARPDEFAKFAAFVGCVVAEDPRLERDPWTVVAGGYRKISGDLAVKVYKEKLRVRRTEDGSYAIEAPSDTASLRFSCPEVTETAPKPSAQPFHEPLTPGLTKALRSLSGAQFVGGRGPTTAPAISNKETQGLPPGTQVELRLRSPEAMLYYLGELARVQMEDPAAFLPMVGTYAATDANDRWPLFVLRKGRTGAAVVSVTRDGTRFFVPKDAAGGRAMSCFKLIAQLIALHKSRDTLPTTQTVIGVGGP